MKKIEKGIRDKCDNGYDKILSTYNSYKHPVIENQTNALVFPWQMQRDVDAIDTLRFSENTTEENQNIGVQGIIDNPVNSKNVKSIK